MTVFLRLLDDVEKENSLLHAVTRYRSGLYSSSIYDIKPEKFGLIPTSPFSYWAGDSALEAFSKFPPLDSNGRTARDTNPQGDDKRFIRAWWEVARSQRTNLDWVPLCKGGRFSPVYSDVHLVVAWDNARNTYLGFQGTTHRPLEKPASLAFFFRPGLTWPRRSQIGLGLRCMPKGCIFAQKGPGAFVEGDQQADLLALLAIGVSKAYVALAQLQMSFGAYEVGVIQRTPVPDIPDEQKSSLSQYCMDIWRLKRTLDTTEETSHAFLLPVELRSRIGNYDPSFIQTELINRHDAIDEIAFNLYELSREDRSAVLAANVATGAGHTEGAIDDEDSEDEDSAEAIDQTDALLSWAVGVAFGRFDWRLATGEREAPPEPDPFDPLPAKSPGMLPDGAAPFHAHSGLLVDDQGHPHDLARLIEEVLTRVEVDVPADVRRWLQRDFFPLHLKQYSKSRRKAPIYWPLSTTSGSYTLWLYHPSLTSQTLYTAVNDFVEPKLKQVSRDAAILRDKGAARTRDDEKAFEALQALELELIELRDTLLDIAPTYRPNHDDGVQITAAPLWPLFRHKPWQKVLKDTWAKLEKGDYDWAHLAMTYWPDRVCEKCKTDKSLAIAHDLEDLYEPVPSTEGGKKKKKGSGA